MHVQIVRFRLCPGASRDTFLELTNQMIAWLKKQEGFVAYELYEGVDWWSDRIAWESGAHARDGLQAFLGTAMAEQMLALVESGHSTFFGRAVASA